MRESAHLLIPQVMPGWQADELIGRGTYGSVYRASRMVAGHTFTSAIKVIGIPSSNGEVSDLRAMGMDALSIRSHFQQSADALVSEIAVMETLKDSPHVVHIEEFQQLERGDDVGRDLFIRMELLEPLPQVIDREGAPDPRTAALIGVHLCDALQRCHDAGIIHRDVKPANVFRSPADIYKLGDFGIARRMDEATRSTKSFAGTRPYMAPEVEGGHYDQSVDTYSLGVMLYRWLNGGKPPFLDADASPTIELLERAQYLRLSGEEPPLPAGEGVDETLALIVHRAVKPNPSLRWTSAAAFGAALQEWLDAESRTERTQVPAGQSEHDFDIERDVPTEDDPLKRLSVVRADDEAAPEAERSTEEVAAYEKSEDRPVVATTPPPEPERTAESKPAGKLENVLSLLATIAVTLGSGAVFLFSTDWGLSPFYILQFVVALVVTEIARLVRSRRGDDPDAALGTGILSRILSTRALIATSAVFGALYGILYYFPEGPRAGVSALIALMLVRAIVLRTRRQESGSSADAPAAPHATASLPTFVLLACLVGAIALSAISLFDGYYGYQRLVAHLGFNILFLAEPSSGDSLHWLYALISYTNVIIAFLWTLGITFVQLLVVGATCAIATQDSAHRHDGRSAAPVCVAAAVLYLVLMYQLVVSARMASLDSLDLPSVTGIGLAACAGYALFRGGCALYQSFSHTS